ncbi:hypothetical protein OPT61_g5444 [Boeremia exigua]|uniref:Uncharacterized protein n=1 Tax=Boeremia exigua TaxID=749465 RepID=A0ACC2IA81_9PLEO|nr:hypothetical protein OPT61_g5444 [Boeremia exigua]
MEAAGAIVGFVAMPLALFQSCVTAFELLKAAQHIGADGDLFSTKLQWEQYQLLQWGHRIGLDSSSPVEADVNWDFAGRILQQLECLLTSAEKLKEKYSLDVEEEDCLDIKGDSDWQTKPVGIGQWIASMRPDMVTLKSHAIKKNNRALKRLRWAVMGRDQAVAIISDIADLVAKLNRLLDSVEREKQKRMDNILLRDILSRSSTASEVEQIQQILESGPSSNDNVLQAAATLKQIRLIIGADTRDDEVKTGKPQQVSNQMPVIRKLKPRKLTPYVPEKPLSYEGMELARYEGHPVLVEWKSIPNSTWEDILPQVKRLAAMLASPAGKDCQALLCVGTLPWKERELCALVYTMPGDAAQGIWSVKTMSELVAEQAQLSLGRRFEIATVMAQAVLQLHTAGWLHKSLRTNNIIFLAPEHAKSADFLQRSPYLIGFEYARSDTATAAAFTQLPDTEPINDLYRHPQARGVRRESYRKQFDVYALGCILLEIGMWKALPKIVAEFLDAGLLKGIQAVIDDNMGYDVPSLLDIGQQEELLQQLRHSAGDAYAGAYIEAVLMEWDGQSGSDVSLDAHHAVLSHLQQCKC